MDLSFQLLFMLSVIFLVFLNCLVFKVLVYYWVGFCLVFCLLMCYEYLITDLQKQKNKISCKMVQKVHTEMVQKVHTEIVNKVHTEMAQNIYTEMVQKVHPEMVQNIYTDILRWYKKYIHTEIDFTLCGVSTTPGKCRKARQDLKQRHSLA